MKAGPTLALQGWSTRFYLTMHGKTPASEDAGCSNYQDYEGCQQGPSKGSASDADVKRGKAAKAGPTLASQGRATSRNGISGS